MEIFAHYYTKAHDMPMRYIRKGTEIQYKDFKDAHMKMT